MPEAINTEPVLQGRQADVIDDAQRRLEMAGVQPIGGTGVDDVRSVASIRCRFCGRSLLGPGHGRRSSVNG
jgi:hypothetical protein